MAKGCSGNVIIKLTRKGESKPVSNAAVVAVEGAKKRALLTDADGRAEFFVATPKLGLSLNPNSEIRPYSLCDFKIYSPGFGEITVTDCQVFPYVTSLLKCSLSSGKGKKHIRIPSHFLWDKKSNSADFVVMQGTQKAGRVNLEKDYHNEFVTVHMGHPSEKAEDKKVSFFDFIVNIASGTVYPTWPDHAVKANILALVTLAKNRLESSFYRSKGYGFDFAGGPADVLSYFDQRMIFEPLKKIAGELLNHIIVGGDKSPVDIEICESEQGGRGFSQWGSVKMATKGKTDEKILKNYFGDDIIVHIPTKKETVYKPECIEKKKMDSSVFTLQRNLNRIAVRYPAVPVIRDVNGRLDRNTEATIKCYQQNFNLPVTGEADKLTLNSISYVCGSLKKYSNTTEEELPGVLIEGDEGCEVVKIQHYVNLASRRYGKFRIPPVTVNGRFDDKTRESINAFQRFKRLTPSGAADKATWSCLMKECEHNIIGNENIKQYPGIPIEIGSQGDYVVYIQNAVNAVFTKISGNIKLVVDGIYGDKTKKAVSDIQFLLGLKPDGRVDEASWKALCREYKTADTIAVG